MVCTDQNCIRLFWNLFSCPWINSIRHLKHLNLKLSAELDENSHDLTEGFLEILELRPDCVDYIPVYTLRRFQACNQVSANDALNSVQAK